MKTKLLALVFGLALSAPALAQQPLQLQQAYASRQLVVETLPDRLKVRLGGRSAITPGEFAELVGDSATASRYDTEYKRMKGTATAMWVGAGVWFTAAPVIALSLPYGSLYEDLMLPLMVSIYVVPPALLGLGFYVYFHTKGRLNRYETWYAPEAVWGLSQDYNQRLYQDLSMGARYRPRLEVRPVVGPGAVALVGRF